MTTSTTTAAPISPVAVPGASYLPAISRALEGLWLLAIFLVPLMFLGRDYAISEAQIAYVEVPKVALLRTIAGSIAVLWAIEWAIKSRAFQGGFRAISTQGLADRLRPSKAVSAFGDWLKVHPTRWFMLAAILFFGSSFISTVLSGSFNTSMWGEIPGQDGYSGYTVASYGILFAVIATHVKSQMQMSRLLGSVVLMGSLVGLYGILQHYGHDFLNLTESTGGGTSRVTIFMGNAIFAGAALSMTVAVTLMTAAINFHNETWGDWEPLSKISQLGRDCLATLLWASVLALQLLGLMFTFSRGPWGGAVLAMVVFLSLVVLTLGWRVLIRTGLALALAGVFSVAFLHWQSSISIVNTGPWLGIALALLGLAGTFITLFVIQRFRRTVSLLGAAGVLVVIVGASVVGPSALSGRGSGDAPGSGLNDDSTGAQISGRLTSIKTEVLGGFVGGRGTHWKVSWTLIKDRPWFEFDDLKLPWLRPLIGYGPDLFRYTYLLESPSEGPDPRPLEPDHAHNFFIHQTVEQGIIGGIASLSLFVAALGVVGHHILRRRQGGSPIYRLLMVGLVAIILGRFLEMMVGVARVSDLTILWVVFGLFAALLSLDDTRPAAVIPDARPSNRNTSRRARRRTARSSEARSFNTGLMIRLAIVAWLVGGIGVVTWQKSVNSVRASVAEGQALKHFNRGELEKTIKELDRAISLAPGVPNYYNNKAQVFLTYQLRPNDFTEPGCNQQTVNPYLVCLGLQSLQSNLESVAQQPFNYRARLAAGNSAFNLQLNESALESYAIAAGMVPNSWSIRNDLAESQIDVGLYDDAIAELDWAFAITGETELSSRGLYLKGRALKELGHLDDAMDSLKHGLSLNYLSEFAQPTIDMLRDIQTEQGVLLDIDYFSRQIDQNAQDPVAHFFRGMAHLTLGNFQNADADIEEARRLGLGLPEVRAHLGYARLKTGGDVGELTRAIDEAPQNALYNAFYAEVQMSRGNYSEALHYLENANILDPDLGLAYLDRGKAYLDLGLPESAREVFEQSVGLNLPFADHYAERGEIQGFFGEYDLAFSDLDEAIRISPNQARFYNSRAKTYANMGDYQRALADLDGAIDKDPENAEFLINRGVLFDLMGDDDRSLADFATAESLGAVDIPSPEVRGQSYFAVYRDTTSTEEDARQLLKLQTETQTLRDIEFYSAVLPNDVDYGFALQTLGQSYLDLEFWLEAIASLSQLIDLSPRTPEAYRYRGDAYLALNRYEEANDDYLQATTLDDFNSENFIARGRGYAAVGEYQLARNDFDTAIRLDPVSSDAYALRGYLSVQSEDYSRAIPDIDRAIQISSLNHDAYFKRANAYIGLGQTSRALADLQQAINLAPTNPEYLYYRGLILYESGDYDAALEDFDGAVSVKQGFAHTDPKNAGPFLARSRTYLRLGDPDQALNDAINAFQVLDLNFDSFEWDGRREEINLRLAEVDEVLRDALTALGRQAVPQITIDVQSADLHELFGDAFSALGWTKEAEEAYQKASDLR